MGVSVYFVSEPQIIKNSQERATHRSSKRLAAINRMKTDKSIKGNLSVTFAAQRWQLGVLLEYSLRNRLSCAIGIT